MSRYTRQYWRSGQGARKGRKSAFGGIVMPHEEVRKLSERIKAHEADELEAFEENLDELFAEAEEEETKEKTEKTV